MNTYTPAKNAQPKFIPYDKSLLMVTGLIVGLGLLMVASASIVVSSKTYHQPFHYLFKQLAFLGISLLFCVVVARVKTAIWYELGPLLLFLTLGMLLLVLLPGVGHKVNGSTRWLNLGFMHMQVSELAKLLIIIYLSGYMTRYEIELKTQAIGFLKPMLLLSVIAILLLLQPDFGAAVVIIATALGMLFLAGVRLWQFAALLCLVLSALAIIAVASPYRLQRLTTFLQPWADQFDSGYQLTQALIAFGRGGYFGVGLGESIQKLFYLPEAHTDFLFAVMAEELGLFGVLCIMGLFAFVVARGLKIARRALKQKNYFCAYLAYGLSLWFAIQVAVNLGVNTGVLPTKGLTLPLMSYGGSSLLVSCILITLLLRIDYESKLEELGVKEARAYQ
jgi:cell division protein FtsW